MANASLPCVTLSNERKKSKSKDKNHPFLHPRKASRIVPSYSTCRRKRRICCKSIHSSNLNRSWNFWLRIGRAWLKKRRSHSIVRTWITANSSTRSSRSTTRPYNINRNAPAAANPKRIVISKRTYTSRKILKSKNDFPLQKCLKTSRIHWFLHY